MPGREFTGQGAAPKRAEGWNPDELHRHVRGRAETTIRILTVGALLRSQNLLPARAAVSVTGARWQDWRGTRDQPRAHRMPCNPQIAGRDLPDFFVKPVTRRRIQDALGETDELPFHVNYADRLFESCGGIESARRGVEQIVAAQKAGGDLDYAAIRNAWRTVLAGYIGAWSAVERNLLDRMGREDAMVFLERVAGFRPNAP